MQCPVADTEPVFGSTPACASRSRKSLGITVPVLKTPISLRSSRLRLLGFISTRFLHANRYPPRIKSGRMLRSKTIQSPFLHPRPEDGLERSFRNHVVDRIQAHR